MTLLAELSMASAGPLVMRSLCKAMIGSRHLGSARPMDLTSTGQVGAQLVAELCSHCDDPVTDDGTPLPRPMRPVPYKAQRGLAKV